MKYIPYKRGVLRTSFNVGRLASFSFAFGGDGGADLGEGGCEVVRGVNEGGAGVTDGEADELDSSPISSKGGE
jgi:hypothetical protein